MQSGLASRLVCVQSGPASWVRRADRYVEGGVRVAEGGGGDVGGPEVSARDEAGNLSLGSAVAGLSRSVHKCSDRVVTAGGLAQANSGTEPPCRHVLPLQRTALHGHSMGSLVIPLHSRVAPRTTWHLDGSQSSLGRESRSPSAGSSACCWATLFLYVCPLSGYAHRVLVSAVGPLFLFFSPPTAHLICVLFTTPPLLEVSLPLCAATPATDARDRCWLVSRMPSL